MNLGDKMRDIYDYELKYQVEPCEVYQVKYRRKKVLELIMDNHPKNVLEIGCGLEPLFEYYNIFEKMVVVEPSPLFAEKAREKATNIKKDIICIEGFFEEVVTQIQKTKIEFDYIVVSSLLHEVENPKKLLEKIAEVCTENTTVHINVPNAKSIHRLLAKKMQLIDDIHELSKLQKKMQRHSVFDMESLSALVEQCGYKVCERGSYFPKFLSAAQMEQMLREGIISEDFFEGLDKMIEYFPDLGSEIFVQLRR